MAGVASPGHKLGQMVGDLLEAYFSRDIVSLCKKRGFFCDRKGPRPARGRSKKVTWIDNRGNSHDLDFVVEKGGSENQRGLPIAFIEIAWRRYTKHSRNKTGELEGALLPLRESYPSCRFVGVVLAGEYTEGGKNQLVSHGITVLHIPFRILADAFKTKGVDLDYAENASLAIKRAAIRQWQSLSSSGLKDVVTVFDKAIRSEYLTFRRKLNQSLMSNIRSVRVLPLYGREMVFSSVQDAVAAVSAFNDARPGKREFVKFEVQLRWADGTHVEGTFNDRTSAVNFLNVFL